MAGSALPCPYCDATLSHRKKITPGRPLKYPIPSWYQCHGCGYQEEASPLTRKDLKKIIVDQFRELRGES